VIATGSLIVTGIPAAGKTTVARTLARRSQLAAHLDIDVIYELILGGLVLRKDSPEEDFWQLALAREHIGMLARSFAAHGVLTFVDDVIPDRPVLDRYLALLPPPVRLVTLAPSTDVVQSRDAARHKQVAARWMHMAETMRRDLLGVGLWLDTSNLDVQETVRSIEQRWDEALVR
jgi:chloramphenicol 3-O-phosphotransferase